MLQRVLHGRQLNLSGWKQDDETSLAGAAAASRSLQKKRHKQVLFSEMMIIRSNAALEETEAREKPINKQIIESKNRLTITSHNTIMSHNNERVEFVFGIEFELSYELN